MFSRVFSPVMPPAQPGAYRRRRVPALAAVCGLILLFGTACGEVQRRTNIQNCNFALADLELVEFGFKLIKLRATLEATNPTQDEALLEKFDFKLALNGTQVGAGSNEAATVIPPGGSARLTLEFSASLSEIGSQIFSALTQGGELRYSIAGMAFVPTFFGHVMELPLNYEGAFSPGGKKDEAAGDSATDASETTVPAESSSTPDASESAAQPRAPATIPGATPGFVR